MTSVECWMMSHGSSRDNLFAWNVHVCLLSVYFATLGGKVKLWLMLVK